MQEKPRLRRISQHTFLANALPLRPVLLDLGMNQGAFSSAFKAAYPGAEIFGCEPVPELFQSLRRVWGDHAHNVAVAGRTRDGSINVYAEHCASMVHADLESDADIVPIQIVSFDELAARLGVARFDLVKIDIEGAELELFLESSAKTLLMCDQITVEFHDFMNKADVPVIRQCVSRLESLGFAAFRCSILNRSDMLLVHPRLLSRFGRSRIQAEVIGAHITAEKARNLIRYVSRRLTSKAGTSVHRQ